jgi:hypothetical protein
MMVGLWPCKVSYEVHINGQCVSEPVREDKGKATVPESEDEKDPKRTRRVLSKGHEVVRLGYSRLKGMLQKWQIEEESRVTLTKLIGFTRNTTRISGQIGLLKIVSVTGMVAQVSRQIGLLGLARVTEIAT